MVGGVVVLFLVVGASPSEERRGEGPLIAELRPRARFTFAFAPTAAFGLTVSPSSVAPKLGLGLAVELGAVIRDRTAVTLHLMGSFFPPTSVFPMGGGGFLMTGGGPTIDWFLNDHWSFGSGTHLAAFFGGVNSVSLMVPFRAHWRPAAREPSAKARQGFVLGFQLGLGLSLIGLNLPSYPANLTVSGLLTAGHGWW